MSQKNQIKFVRQERCQVCESADQRHYTSHDVGNFPRLNFVICEQCSLVYMDPVPDLESYALIYSELFWDLAGGRDLDTTQQARDFEATRAKRIELINLFRLESMDRILDRALDDGWKGKRVLEIGSAWGATLNHLHERHDVEVAAIEPSRQARTYMEETHPFIEIVCHALEDVYEDTTHDGRFGLIINSHSLENIVDQNRAIETIRRLMTDDGVWYLQTPNLLWHRRAINQFHPVIYAPRNLAQMLHKHGLYIERMEATAPPSLDPLRTGARFLRKDFSPYITAVIRKCAIEEETSMPMPNWSAGQVRRRSLLAHAIVRAGSRLGRWSDRALGRTGKVVRL